LLQVAAAVDQYVDHTGVDLSKILLGQNQIWGHVVKADKCMGVSRFIFWGYPGCPQSLRLWWSII